MEIEPLTFPGVDPKRPMIIAGPCSAESREQVLKTASELAARGVKIFRAGIWKPRTKPGGFEGIGVEGLPWMKQVKQETGMLVATEVATPVYRRRRALAARILETLGCDVRDDQVGMFLWGRVNDTLAAQLTAAGECPNGVGEAICNRVLYQSRVFVTPGFIFGSEGRNYIRISLCCNEEMLQEALDRITTTRTKQNQ